GQLYVAKPEVLQQSIFKEFLESHAIQTYDFKRSKVLLSRLGIQLPQASFDSRLAKYLLSTVEDNTLSTIAQLYGATSLPADEIV
ncbi:hypothetical protein ACXWO4_10345, partial [Streptococcus pyogenes]